VEISTYVMGAVAALTVASCMTLGMGLALRRRGRPRRISGHTPGGRVLSPTASSGLWSRPYGQVGPSTSASRPGEPGSRRRPLTPDQQATRDAWARWRAEQGR